MGTSMSSRCSRLVALSSVVWICVGVVGCDAFVGASGANSVVTVKYRPASKEVVAASAESNSGTSENSTPVGEGGVGTLNGRVVYVGDFSPLAPLFAKGTATKDPSVCGAEEIPNESIQVKNGGLANTFIYLEKAPKGAVVPPVGEPVVFDQKVCIFIPHSMVVRVKQTIKILNADGAAHNTHTYPKKGTVFNSVVQPNDRNGVDLVYGQVEREPVSVGCDIHPWMQAYHLPLDHPYAAVSSEDGTFQIKDLPAGKHEFKVWHEVGKMVEKSLVVTIKPGDNEVTINVPANKLGK